MNRDMYYYGYNRNLRRELNRFEGHPVKIFTDDRRSHCGIDEQVFGNAVRLIDRCGRRIFVGLPHVSSFVEPQMVLRRCCHDRCECDNERSRRRRRRDRDCDRDFDRFRDRDFDRCRDRDRDCDREFDRFRGRDRY